jgi:hypothetical protein
MGLNPKQVKLLLIFFPISSNPCVLGITEQALIRFPLPSLHVTVIGSSSYLFVIISFFILKQILNLFYLFNYNFSLVRL